MVDKTLIRLRAADRVLTNYPDGRMFAGFRVVDGW